jgi:hypothetical protein
MECVSLIDTLALHLGYDKSSQTLSLFSFPSMCTSQLWKRRSTIYSFASTEIDATDFRADDDDMVNFLEQMLLSFQVMFCQSS